MGLGENIKFRRIQLGLTQQQLADALGYKSRSTIAKIEVGENDITRTKVKEFAQVLKTTTDFLMDGDADKISKFSSCTYSYVPEGISAGTLQNVSALTDLEKLEVPDVLMGRYAKDKDIVFMHVNGESMNRIISDGSLIAVKTNLDRPSYKNGDIVIASNGRDYTVKYFYDDPLHRQFILNPDSSDKSFTPIICRYDEDDYTLIGKVVIYSVIL